MAPGEADTKPARIVEARALAVRGDGGMLSFWARSSARDAPLDDERPVCTGGGGAANSCLVCGAEAVDAACLLGCMDVSAA